jgi:uncharacterized protein (TIGR03435 family)
VDAALAWLDSQLHLLDAETVPLRSAAGRVLAAPVVSAVDVPGFDRDVLITTRTGGQLGPSLRVSSTDCTKDPTPCAIQSAPGRLSAKALDMDTLISILAVPAQRMIVDRTGLAGRFDVELNWRPFGVSASSSDDAVDLFSAVQEQLGLKLEPATGDVEVLVIDHVARPNEN